MIPHHPVGASSEVKQFYQDLHLQLGPDYKVSQYLDSSTNLNGTLLWIEFKLQSLFVFISEVSKETIGINKNQKSLQEQIIQNTEIQDIINLKKSLLPKKIQTFHPRLTPIIVIYNHVSEASLNIKLNTLGLSLLGKETLTKTNLKPLLHKFMGSPTSKTIHQYIRQIFNPEIRIFSKKPNKDPDSIFDYTLLNKEQESALKTDIYLPSSERNTANYNLSGVNGGSYSGKSEIIIQREKLLRSLNPSQKILILSPNKASKRDLINRYKQLSSNDQNTSILSYHDWCQQQLSPSAKLTNINTLSDATNSKINHFLVENDMTLSTFFHELDFIHGRQIFYKAHYLKAKEVINSNQLNETQCSNIWKLIITLKNDLKSKNQILRCSLPQLLWDSLQSKSFTKPYDHILVDDAHLFPPIAFELIKKVIKPKTGQIFITQDPNQGIINPCTLWKDTGLDLRGKSTRLLNSYQTNAYIINAANAFYLQRLPDDNDKVIQFVFNIDKGFKKPQLLHFNNERDEENRLLNEIKVLINNETELEDILLITMDKKASSHLAELIRQTLNISVSLIDESTERKNGLSVCDLMLAQGLKSEYVFIFGLQQFMNAEKNIEDQDIGYTENTRQLNMAMTSAQRELTLFLTADEIPKDFISPHIETPTTNEEHKAEVRYLRGS